MADYKVLMIGREYPPHNSGGLGVACEGLTESLAQNQVQLTFTLPYPDKFSLDHMKLLQFDLSATGLSNMTKSGFSVYVSSQLQSKSEFKPNQLWQLSSQELEDRVNQYASQIAQAVANQGIQPDLIHAHDWMTYPAASLLKRKTKRPFVAHIHSTEFDRVPHGNGHPLISHLEKSGLEDSDKIIAVSELTKQVLIDRYQIDGEKIEVIHNGVKPAEPVASQKFAQGRPVVVFMGRLTMQKGGEYFLTLARKVLEKIPNCLFVVAGDGDQYSLLLIESAKKKLTSSVIFSGFVRGSQKDFLLDRSDVFVMPSISEPFGLVALEAIQRDTPVIISKTSGVSEVLPGAINVDFWDVDLTAQHVISLLVDPKYYYQTLDRQLEDLSGITWKVAADRVKQTYQKILNSR